MDTNPLRLRFIQALNASEPDLNQRHIHNVYSYVFKNMVARHQIQLDGLSYPDLKKFVHDWQADLPTPGLDIIGEELCTLVQNYQDIVQPAAEKVADAAAENLDFKEAWEWVFARLPLDRHLAAAINVMTHDQLYAFACGDDPTGNGRPVMQELARLFPEANIPSVTARLNTLYVEGENVAFGME